MVLSRHILHSGKLHGNGYSLECMLMFVMFADIWKVRIGVLVARGGVSVDWSTGAPDCKAVSVLEFGGGIDISRTISARLFGG